VSEKTNETNETKLPEDDGAPRSPRDRAAVPMDEAHPIDSGEPNVETGSYSMLEPRFRELYFRFYKETYKPSALDRKTKELIAIAASLAAHCQGCLDGHIQKALKSGATREEIGEAIIIALGVKGASVVDMTDIAAKNLNIKLY
jgi:AhpD family alkylhydroperoxidase